jgi:hypothetical protein
MISNLDDDQKAASLAVFFMRTVSDGSSCLLLLTVS